MNYLKDKKLMMMKKKKKKKKKSKTNLRADVDDAADDDDNGRHAVAHDAYPFLSWCWSSSWSSFALSVSLWPGWPSVSYLSILFLLLHLHLRLLLLHRKDAAEAALLHSTASSQIQRWPSQQWIQTIHSIISTLIICSVNDNIWNAWNAPTSPAFPLESSGDSDSLFKPPSRFFEILWDSLRFFEILWDPQEILLAQDSLPWILEIPPKCQCPQIPQILGTHPQLFAGRLGDFIPSIKSIKNKTKQKNQAKRATDSQGCQTPAIADASTADSSPTPRQPIPTRLQMIRWNQKKKKNRILHFLEHEGNKKEEEEEDLQFLVTFRWHLASSYHKHWPPPENWSKNNEKIKQKEKREREKEREERREKEKDVHIKQM